MATDSPRPSFPDLAGKRVLVTGSTRGIGAALARGFAEAGCRVAVHGRRAADAEALAATLPGGAVGLAADLSTEAGARSLAAAAVEASGGLGGLDVLVNNAGYEALCAVEDLADAVPEAETTWRVNVLAPMLLTSLLVEPLAVSGSGAIVNVTSIHETVPCAQNAVYCASKAALGMFTRTSAIELAPRGIRVNSLAPGAIETDMNRELIAGTGDLFKEAIPAGRVGVCEEMIGPALFLASSASSYVTGASLLADGGYAQHLVRYRPADLEAGEGS